MSFDVVVACSPAFAASAKLRFEHLGPGESRTIAPLDLKPDHVHLAQLDESERATISVTAFADGKEIGEASHSIDVLSYEQWAGPGRCQSCLPPFACRTPELSTR